MVRETSIEAYNEIKENGLLSKKRFQVYDILFRLGPMTGAQVSNVIKKGNTKNAYSETVRNRLTELRNSGVVREVGEVICPITGRRVIQWDVTKKTPTKWDKPIRETCRQCGGKGYLEFHQGRLF